MSTGRFRDVTSIHQNGNSATRARPRRCTRVANELAVTEVPSCAACRPRRILSGATMAVFWEEPLGSLEAFLAVLADIERGDRAPYPFYCALLYTNAEGP